MSAEMIKVGVYGATGRVGRLVIEDLAAQTELTLSTVYIRKTLDFMLPEGTLATNDLAVFIENCDIIIDFSLPEALEALTVALLKTPRPLVSGTTGLSIHQQNLLTELSQAAPVLYATNMSMGVAMLNRLVSLASKSLDGFDIEIVEMHHRHKKDAPSGTALTLCDSAAKARGLDPEKVRVSGRNGHIDERSGDEIAVMALRGGDIVGRHTVGFYNDGEFIELSHTATRRNTFSQGALRAARWLMKQPSGLYGIADCLDLR